jgi:hypothetical protein
MELGSNPLVEELRAALLREWEKPPRERFQAMVDRGAIDSEGRVLLRAPHHTPKAERKKRGTSKP